MTVLALASVKHAPGVTTTAVALASAWLDAVVVELDPSGGDVAARARLPFDPGVMTLAASGRHPGARLNVQDHAQALPSGGSAVVSPPSPELASNALMTLGPRVAHVLEGANAILDCGRLMPASPSLPIASAADALVIVVEPTVGSVEHVRVRLPFLRDVHPTVAVVLVGDRPYRPADVEDALDVPVAGALAIDPRGVAALYAGTAGRRSALVRSARTVLDVVQGLLGSREAVQT